GQGGLGELVLANLESPQARQLLRITLERLVAGRPILRIRRRFPELQTAVAGGRQDQPVGRREAGEAFEADMVGVVQHALDCPGVAFQNSDFIAMIEKNIPAIAAEARVANFTGPPGMYLGEPALASLDVPYFFQVVPAAGNQSVAPGKLEGRHGTLMSGL